jgi:hypothetical protein
MEIDKDPIIILLHTKKINFKSQKKRRRKTFKKHDPETGGLLEGSLPYNHE